MNVLILYGTRHNSTAEVARFIGDILAEHELKVTVADVEDFDGDMSDYDAYLFGTCIYNSMWLPSMIERVSRAVPKIGQKPVWGWVNCIRILESGGEAYIRENYLPDEVLDQLNIQDYKIFAGKLFIQDVDFSERWTLSVRYDGDKPPTHFNADYRDWEAIGAWGQSIARQLAARIQS